MTNQRWAKKRNNSKTNCYSQYHEHEGGKPGLKKKKSLLVHPDSRQNIGIHINQTKPVNLLFGDHLYLKTVALC